jgi:hypothetical protein
VTVRGHGTSEDLCGRFSGDHIGLRKSFSGERVVVNGSVEHSRGGSVMGHCAFVLFNMFYLFFAILGCFRCS